MYTITFTLDTGERTRLEHHANRQGLSMADAVRKLLAERLADLERMYDER